MNWTNPSAARALHIKQFSQPEPYAAIWQAMRRFTDERQADTPDQLWLLQHEAVFTQGQAGQATHVLQPGMIPVIQTDRGGQVTYHGPGQLIAYPLCDLKRLAIGPRGWVRGLEEIIIRLLADLGIHAKIKAKAPGVYVDESKICSIGLRVRRGCSYHGIALNVKMDLEPFKRINPCGFTNLKMTQISQWLPNIKCIEVEKLLVKHFIDYFAYTLFEG